MFELKQVPRQQNGRDCGLYICLFARVMLNLRFQSFCHLEINKATGELRVLERSKKLRKIDHTLAKQLRMQWTRLLDRMIILQGSTETSKE